MNSNLFKIEFFHEVETSSGLFFLTCEMCSKRSVMITRHKHIWFKKRHFLFTFSYCANNSVSRIIDFAFNSSSMCSRKREVVAREVILSLGTECVVYYKKQSFEFFQLSVWWPLWCFIDSSNNTFEAELFTLVTLRDMTVLNTHVVRRTLSFWFLLLGWFLSHSQLNSKGQQ